MEIPENVLHGLGIIVGIIQDVGSDDPLFGVDDQTRRDWADVENACKWMRSLGVIPESLSHIP